MEEKPNEMPAMPERTAEDVQSTLHDLLPVLLTELLLCGAMVGVYALAGYLSQKVLLGAALGAAAALVNFGVMVLLLFRAERAESPAKGQLYVRGTYTVRMVVLLAALVVALKSGYFDPLATVLPLLFMRLSLFTPRLWQKKKGGNA